MTQFEKLEAILACVQTDPGNRGLHPNSMSKLHQATRGDFAAACWCVAQNPYLNIHTGFCIASIHPPQFETDGPLGAVFLWRMGYALSNRMNLQRIVAEYPVHIAVEAALKMAGPHELEPFGIEKNPVIYNNIWIERAGSAEDDNCYSMRGMDITSHMYLNKHTLDCINDRTITSIGIGDGGNEIGMGKIPHEIIVKNIPNGDLIHCRVPTDHLIVAGVSNWGAYALAAGVYVLRNEKPPANLFDPDYERKILQVMVDAGPLVDGVTGRQEATVDGLSWDEYVKPLIEMREILAK